MTMIEQLLQQRITIHTPLFSIRTNLIATAADDHDAAGVPCYCSHCKRKGLTTVDFYVRETGKPSSWCKECTRGVAAETRQKSKKGTSK